MKYRSSTYAQSLVNSLLDKKTDDKKIVTNFLALLEKNQDIKKSGEILALAEKLLLKKTGNKKIILETARDVNTKDFIKFFAKKGDMVEERINPALIAGLKIIVNQDRQLDLSLLHKLENIF